MFLGSFLFDNREEPIKLLLINRNSIQEANNLLLEVSFLNASLRAQHTALLTCAVVVHIVAPISIHLLLCGDAASTRPAPDQSGVGENMPFGARPAGFAEQYLRTLELFERNHRLMPSWIP